MAIQVVILAAGLGTRLGKPHPKPLTPQSSGEPIMRRAVDQLRGASGDEVFMTAVRGFGALGLRACVSFHSLRAL